MRKRDNNEKVLPVVEDTQPEHLSPKWHDIPAEFELNPVQLEARKVLFSNHNLLVSAKPNTGKTAIARMFAQRTLEESRRGIVVYVGIQRALASEKHQEWTATNHPWAAVPQMLVSGDVQMTTSQRDRLEESRVVCITPEALLSRIRKATATSWVHRIHTLILDEVHLVMDKGRGPNYEAVISEIFAVCPQARFIFLSGTLPNPEDFEGWMSRGSVRPVHSVISDWTPIEVERHWCMVPSYPYPAKQTATREEVMRIVFEATNKDETVLIAVWSKSFGKAIVEDLRKRMQIVADFHNADLDREERYEVETKFRMGKTKVLVATSTLFTGVNLPATHVIITAVDMPFVGDIPVHELLQAAGRAGRIGLSKRGVQHFILPDAKFKHHKTRIQNPPPIMSWMLEVEHLEAHLLAAIVSGEVTKASEISDWHHRTLSAVQVENGRATANLSKSANEALDALVRHQAIVEDDDHNFEATEMGALCVKYMIHPKTLIRAVIGLSDLANLVTITPIDIASVFGRLPAGMSSLNSSDKENRNAWAAVPFAGYKIPTDLPDSHLKATAGLMWRLRDDLRGHPHPALYSPTKAVVDELPRLALALVGCKQRAGQFKELKWRQFFEIIFTLLTGDLDKSSQLCAQVPVNDLRRILATGGYHRSLNTLLRHHAQDSWTD